MSKFVYVCHNCPLEEKCSQLKIACEDYEREFLGESKDSSFHLRVPSIAVYERIKNHETGLKMSDRAIKAFHKDFFESYPRMAIMVLLEKLSEKYKVNPEYLRQLLPSAYSTHELGIIQESDDPSINQMRNYGKTDKASTRKKTVERIFTLYTP